MCRWVALFVLLLCGCRSDSADERPAAVEKGAAPKTSKKPGAGTLSNLAALSSSPAAVALRLGAHRVTCKTTLQTRVAGTAPREVVQQMVLSVDKKGRFSAVKDIGVQHGQEVIWAGDWLYPRARHGKFLRRRPRVGEPKKIFNRMAGHLPATVKLLAPSLILQSRGETTHEQRRVLRVSMTLAPNPKKAPGDTSLSRRWRQTIKVKSLNGMVLLDARTRVPLSVDLTAAWTFTPPAAGKTPPSGIPRKLDPGATGTMKLNLSQRVTLIGKVEPIQPPPAAEVMDPRRVRLERERQMFSGEIPIPQQKQRRTP